MRKRFKIPKMYEGCTMDQDPTTCGFQLLTKNFKNIPHWHCPVCGAIANLICYSEGCLGCELCYQGYHGAFTEIITVPNAL